MVRTSLATSLPFSFALLTFATLPAAAATEYVLWSFAYPYEGFPQGRLLIHGTSLYGTASGSSYGNGQAFQLHDSGGTWKIKTTAAFAGTDGGNPLAGLIADSTGAYYGTTSTGDVNGGGNVFKVWYTGGKWYHGTVWAFGGSGDGSDPTSDLIQDSLGNLYGTTYSGATLGTVFELSNSGGTWTESVLYKFGQSIFDGTRPRAGLLMDKSGNLYGTTSEGGDPSCSSFGCGSVFELSQSGGVWTENQLYAFPAPGDNGAIPFGGLIKGTKGVLYGTASQGGASGCGVVFDLKQHSGVWTESTIYNFKGGTDGCGPVAALRFNSSGALFGTTESGGGGGCGGSGCGTVFEMTQSGGVWGEAVLHDFGVTTGDGIHPNGAVVIDKSGNLYGTTFGGGAYSSGTVWAVTP